MAHAEQTPSSLAQVGPVADGILCDILWGPCPVHREAELAARHATGYSLVSLSMAGDEGASPAEIYAYLAKMRYYVSNNPDTMVLVDTVADIRQAKKDGKLGINFHFQGSEPVGRNLANIEAYYKLGVRWMLMAYNFQNNVGTGCLEGETNDIGLSAFGRDVVAEMNRVGMLVDCTHSGHRTTMDAMELSTAPCIFSHSNPRALFDHPRNIRDDQIKACAATGGVIGVNGVGQFMGEKTRVTIDHMLRHIDYLAEKVGPRHIALGLDYMTPLHCQVLYDFYGGNVSAKIGMPELPWAFFDPAEVPALLNRLLDKGYSVEDVRGIAGENFLRVAEQVWK